MSTVGLSGVSRFKYRDLLAGLGEMPASRFDRRGTILLVLGILVAIGAGLGFIVGLSYLAGFPYYDAATGGALIGVCGVVPLVPGLLLVWAGTRDRRHASRLQMASGYVTAYRRIRMTDLANHLGVPLPEAERIVTEAIGGGDLQAFVDSTTNEVVAAAAVNQERFIGPCPRCGAQVDQWYLPGDAVRCPFCGTEFAARLPTP